jgi:hypothetical protein
MFHNKENNFNSQFLFTIKLIRDVGNIVINFLKIK